MARAFLYMDTLPDRTGSGAHLRMYSNVRAYADLGLDVEVVHLSARDGGPGIDGALGAVELTRIAVAPRPASVVSRLSYRLGLPSAAACRYYYPLHAATRAAVEQREAAHPDAVHQVEGESLANVIPFVPRARVIWSVHEPISSAVVRTVQAGAELEGRGPTVAEEREIRFTGRMERRVAQASPLVLTISPSDRDMVRSKWGVDRVEHLPMSVPDENRFAPHAEWMRGGKLRVLHLGAIAQMPTFRSLQLLLGEVFPTLDPETLARLELVVAGSYDPEHPRVKHVLELAARFPQVSLLGFVDDLGPLYESCDVQIVASPDATGLRTRVIESLAWHLPVISTPAAAEGVIGSEPGRNMLVAAGPPELAETLRSLTRHPERLPEVARAGRQTYDRLHARGVVAEALRDILARRLAMAV